MKKMFFIFSIVLLLTYCTKNSNDPEVSSDLENEFFVETEDIQDIEMPNMNNEISVIVKNSDYNINEILEYIFNDLDLKNSINSIEELLQTINLPENFNIVEYEAERGWTIYFYNIEWDEFIISYLTSDYIDYYLFNYLEIELADNNYLSLFPYISIKGYINDSDFGTAYERDNYLLYFIYEKGEENSYGVHDYSCRLIFNNGLLKSIRIDPYRT